MDNKSKQGWHDDIQIDIHSSYEMTYIRRKHGYTPGNIAVAMHMTKSTFRKKVIGWLDKNWSRISRV